jgi:hypothetical protein
MRSRSFALPLLFLTGIADLACTGTETGNPTKSSVAFSLESSDDKHFSLGQDGAGINIASVRIGIQNLTFIACADQATTQVAQAVTVDLRSGESTFEVPQPQVCQIALTLEPRDLGWTQVHPGAEAKLSLGVAGLTTLGAPLFVEDGTTPAVVFRPPALPVKPGTELVLSLDVAKLLNFDELEQLTPDSSGEVAITGQLNGATLANIQQRWPSSWSLSTVNESGGLQLIVPGEAQ